MPDSHMRYDSRQLVAITNVDIKRTFAREFIFDGKLKLPTAITTQNLLTLPDVRPVNPQATAEALSGNSPKSDPLGQFDPGLGPFSSSQSASSPWAQSLDFMRDIALPRPNHPSPASTWLITWLQQQSHDPNAPISLFAHPLGINTTTNRLIWRSRRVINCLSYVIGLLQDLDASSQQIFWHSLVADIAKLAAPSNGLWASILEGLDPLSPRARWSRAIAILSVEAIFPAYLKPEIIDCAESDISEAIQSDGMMLGGSISATLSAGADLAMLTRLVALQPIRNRVCSALTSLRSQDGKLVTFGDGYPDHKILLNAILSTCSPKSPTLLSTAGIAQATGGGARVWLRGAIDGSAWGALCEVEIDGDTLVTNLSDIRSGLIFPSQTSVSRVKTTRRDEVGAVVLESRAILTIGGEETQATRYIRLSADGRTIKGQDALSRQANRILMHIDHIAFVIPKSCHVTHSRDRKSILIVTRQQQGWRFRCASMDISVETASKGDPQSATRSDAWIINCSTSDSTRTGILEASWNFEFEDLL